MTTSFPFFGYDLVGSPYLLLNLFLTALLVGLVLALLADSYIDREHKRNVLIILLLTFSLILQTVLEHRISEGTPQPFLRTVLSIYGYCVRPVLVVLVFYLIADGEKTLPAWILTGINAAVYLTALFAPLAFWITKNNVFHRGPLGFTCHVVTALLLANLVCLTVRKYGRVRWQDAVIPIFNSAIIAASIVLDYLTPLNHPVSCLNIAIVIGCALYYIWIHLQFVREHERSLHAEQRIQIMMTQIQPHFLYNTIATFKALCRKDPERAAELADKFGVYLRQNLDSLGVTGNIPFQKELEHTRLYTEIEMVRFENIRVEYDIADDGFDLPPLTLQPMVENAIRHGVRSRRDGLVRVVSRRRETCHEIVIEDNGIGFDPNAMESTENGHIGIRNVRERIEQMCSGMLILESKVGEGTTVTIRIPAKGATA